MKTDTHRREVQRMLSTEEVAQMLAVKPKTVRRWITSGELPAAKLHRQWRIRADALEGLLADDSDAA